MISGSRCRAWSSQLKKRISQGRYKEKLANVRKGKFVVLGGRFEGWQSKFYAIEGESEFEAEEGKSKA